MISHEEARLQHLTVQAKRIWDEEQVIEVSNGLKGCDPTSAYVRTEAGIVFTISTPNDRALDALEAAMLAVESADSTLNVEQYKRAWVEGFDTGVRVGVATTEKPVQEPPYLGVVVKDAMDQVHALQAEIERRDQVMENLIAELKALPDANTLSFVKNTADKIAAEIKKAMRPERA